MRDIRIDDEFARLIPPLTEDENSRLEESLLKEGCRDALVLWGNILVDGHNRYKICTRHGIHYDTKQLEFKSRDEVLLWIMENQLGRRNLSDFQRIELVRKCEDAVKAQAKLRQQGGQGGILLPEILPEAKRIDARDELGAMAGVSGKTYEHAAIVLDKAPEPVVEATRRKELSINAAYGVTKLTQADKEEIVRRIENGEKAALVVREVRLRAEGKDSEDEAYEPEAYEPEPEESEMEDSELIATTEEEPAPEDDNPKQEDTYSAMMASKLEEYSTDLTDGVETFNRIYEMCKRDCVLYLWVKASDIQRAFVYVFGTGERDFKKALIAIIWTEDGEIQEVCFVGTRGKAKKPDGLKSRIIEAPSENGKRPAKCDELTEELKNLHRAK